MLFLLLFFIKSSFETEEDKLTLLYEEIHQLRTEIQELRKLVFNRDLQNSIPKDRAELIIRNSQESNTKPGAEFCTKYVCSSFGSHKV